MTLEESKMLICGLYNTEIDRYESEKESELKAYHKGQCDALKDAMAIISKVRQS